MLMHFSGEDSRTSDWEMRKKRLTIIPKHFKSIPGWRQPSTTGEAPIIGKVNLIKRSRTTHKPLNLILPTLWPTITGATLITEKATSIALFKILHGRLKSTPQTATRTTIAVGRCCKTTSLSKPSKTSIMHYNWIRNMHSHITTEATPDSKLEIMKLP